ncbi:MAG: DNA gyrase inhibitor YacG, partial [Nitratireductor sp.]
MNTADGFKVTPLRPRAKCPECGKPSARPTFPFCSTRCKDVDLNR